jgi:hypothetical protein
MTTAKAIHMTLIAHLDPPPIAVRQKVARETPSSSDIADDLPKPRRAKRGGRKKLFNSRCALGNVSSAHPR